MRRDDRFTRGVFTCIVCHRRTRGSADSADLDLCIECLDLLQQDNRHNDNGTTPNEQEMERYNELLRKCVLAGGDGERVKGHCLYIWKDS